MKKKAYHGGAFWDGINPDFDSLEKSTDIINADVLDAWFDPSPRVIEKVSQFLPLAIKTSPPTHSKGLIKAISKYRKIPENHIVVGSGSSDLMFAFFPNILKKNDKILILDPMYGEYAHIFENVVDVQLVRHKLTADQDFIIDYDLLNGAIQSNNPQMVVLVNPNSPTGKYWEKENILKLIESHPSIIFVVDETYIEYVGKEKSIEQDTEKHNNLVVIKSMSKVYALSGARVGYIISHPDILEKFSSFIPPWSVSLIGQIAGVEALKDEEYYKAKWAETRILRENMIKDLQNESIKIFDSVANFFLVQLKSGSAEKIVLESRKENIYLINCNSISSQFNDDFIRIAVKDEKMNQIVVEALKKFL